MVPISVPGMYGWGNPSAQLPGVLGPSPSHRSGLGAPFFVGQPRHYALTSLTRTNPPSQFRGLLTKGSAGLARWTWIGAARQ